MKATFKNIDDLKQQLTYGQRIKLVGKKVTKMPKNIINSLKTKWKNTVNRLNDYVEEEKNQIIQNKTDALNEKIEAANNVHDKYASMEQFNKEGTIENDYLQELNGRIQKLEERKTKVENKKFGLMRVSFMALKKLTSGKIAKAQDKIAKKKQDLSQKINEKKELIKNKASLVEAYNIYMSQMNLIKKMQEFQKTYGCTAEEYLKNNINVDYELADAKPVTR